MYVIAVAGVFMLYRRSPASAVGLALWLAASLPTQSIVPKLDALTNRPLSLAFAGLVLAVAPLVEMALRWRPTAEVGLVFGRRLATVAAAVVAVVLVASLTTATARRADLFRSELRIWQDAAAKSLVNERPYLQYGYS